MSLSNHSSVKCQYIELMTIQVRYSHTQCSYVLKHKIMTEDRSQQEPARVCGTHHAPRGTVS